MVKRPASSADKATTFQEESGAQDLFDRRAQLGADYLVAVEADDPIRLCLIDAVVDVPVDEVLALEETAVRVGSADLSGPIGAEHVDDDDLVTPLH